MHIKIYGSIKINKCDKFSKKSMYDPLIMLFLEDFNQVRIQNPVKHLTWTFLQK